MFSSTAVSMIVSDSGSVIVSASVSAWVSGSDTGRVMTSEAVSDSIWLSDSDSI